MIKMLKRNQLHQYQKDLITKAKTVTNLALFLPPGLGKTTTSMTILAEQFEGTTLIVAPKRVAESVWMEEASKWEHLKDLKIAKVMGTPSQRLQALKSSSNMYVVNLENLTWLLEQNLRTFDNLIIDESSRFKDPSTKRFKALKKHLKNFKRRIILTGTPTPQGMADLWSQVGILDLGQRLETTLTKFREKYLQPDQMNRHTNVVYSWKLRYGADQTIKDKISDICFSLKAEDYLELPPLTSIYQQIEISDKDRQKYEQLKKDMVTNLGKELITAPTAAALAGKLLQFTSGAVYAEDGEAQEVHRAKLECLESIMEESSSPTLVFYHFKHSLQRLRLQFQRRWCWTMTTLQRGALGMGPDGHTASLFPRTEALHEMSRLVTANHVPQKDAWRITLTWPVINRANSVFFLISGADKAMILKEVLTGPKDVERLPSQLIRPASGILTLFLDKHAASLLPATDDDGCGWIEREG